MSHSLFRHKINIKHLKPVRKELHSEMSYSCLVVLKHYRWTGLVSTRLRGTYVERVRRREDERNWKKTGVEVWGGGVLAGCKREVWEEVASGWDLQEERQEESSLLLTCVFLWSPLWLAAFCYSREFMQAF